LWATEHGSSDYNELNRITPGSNYGWPIVRAEPQSDGYEPPVFHLRDMPPAGAAFITGGRYPEFEGDLAFAMLGTGSLMLARIGDDNQVTGLEWMIDERFGRLRDVVLGPDGYLYVTTSNRDQIGAPQPGDDHVLRILRF
jgi:glucose/arabinose dehydrogenase